MPSSSEEPVLNIDFIMENIAILTNGYIAYHRGNGYWSVFRQILHPNHGYQTGEKFVVRFRASSPEEIHQKWASY